MDVINRLFVRGMFFWDYGNVFLLEVGRVGKDCWLFGERERERYEICLKRL